MTRGSLLLILLILAASGGAAPLESSVKVNGVVYKLTSGFRKGMCHAVIHEMIAEVEKHNLRKAGEEDIFDTAGMAICIGVVQGYTVEQRRSGKWSIRRKTEAEKEREDEGDLVAPFEALMMLKETCMEFCEEWQQDISEVVYKKVGKESPDAVAKAFCERLEERVVEEEKKRRAPKSSTKKKAKKEPQQEASYEEVLAKMNRDGAISEMIRADRENPAEFLPPEEQRNIQVGVPHVVCEVCRTAVRKVKKQMDGAAAHVKRDEAAVSQMVVEAFFGSQDELDMDYTPGNPPEWAKAYTVAKGQKGRWELKRLKQGEASSEEEYVERVRGHTMIAQAARMAHERAEEDLDLGEFLVTHNSWDSNRIASTLCRAVCGAPAEEL